MRQQNCEKNIQRSTSDQSITRICVLFVLLSHFNWLDSMRRFQQQHSVVQIHFDNNDNHVFSAGLRMSSKCLCLRQYKRSKGIRHCAYTVITGIDTYSSVACVSKLTTLFSHNDDRAHVVAHQHLITWFSPLVNETTPIRFETTCFISFYVK